MSLKVFHIVFITVAGAFLALFAGWSFLFAPGLDRGLAVALGIAALIVLLALIFTERCVLARLPRRN